MVVRRTDVGVWLLPDGKSVERTIAERAMQSLGLDPNDFKQRDRVVLAISATVTSALDAAYDAAVKP